MPDAEPSIVSSAGVVATGGGTVTVLGAVAAGRDVRIGSVTVVTDDGPPVGDQLGRPGGPTAICPYPGLSAFGPEQADLFFGREADRDAILAQLGRSRLVAVVGSSGSGKSSLLAASVAPAARAGGGPTIGWDPVLVRPGPDPLSTLRSVVDRPRGDRPTLWMFDQFEEVFDPSVDPARRSMFFDELLQLTVRGAAQLRPDRVALGLLRRPGRGCATGQGCRCRPTPAGATGPGRGGSRRRSAG